MPCTPYSMALVLASVTLHELGHFCALTALGQSVREIGALLLLWVLPVGMYIAHGDLDGCTWKQKRRIALAGVEMNLLLAGAFLLLSAAGGALSATFLSAAAANLAMFAFNLLPADGLDGEKALSAVFEVESIAVMARLALSEKGLRRRFLRSGVGGTAFLCMFALLRASKLLVYGVMLLDAALHVLAALT